MHMCELCASCNQAKVVPELEIQLTEAQKGSKVESTDSICWQYEEADQSK